MARSRKFGPHMTKGGAALRAYLDERGISVPRFCEEKGLDRIQVQRMLNGERKRVSLDFAASIDRATNGVVAMLLWNEPLSMAPSI